MSPVYETPALLPPGAPFDWNRPYLNAVCELDWSGTAELLLHRLKHIECELGRDSTERWSPRKIDLDLLLLGQERIHDETLQVPHARIHERSFVLDPLKDLAPGLTVPGCAWPVVNHARALPGHRPLTMAIFNLTPDSFSDGGALSTKAEWVARVQAADAAGVQILDLGAESTRPGAFRVEIEEEWARLEPVLTYLREFYRSQTIRPWISVDTRHASTADRALAMGADIVNDVGGLSDPRMIEVLAGCHAQYILMHSLTVPADPKLTWQSQVDPIAELKSWFFRKMELLVTAGIDADRVIFDPGIGFGKTQAQSLEILQRFEELSDLPIRLLVGHSRKSCLREGEVMSIPALDEATFRWSRRLARTGVDIIRVHDFRRYQGEWL